MVVPIRAVRACHAVKTSCEPEQPIIRLEGVEVVPWESYQAQGVRAL